jgi:hypothetical protein
VIDWRKQRIEKTDAAARGAPIELCKCVYQAHCGYWSNCRRRYGATVLESGAVSSVANRADLEGE